MLMDALRKDIFDNSEGRGVPASCRACEARRGGVCAAMDPAQLTELNRYSVRKKIEAGSELHGQGEMVVSYANILKGVVKLTKMLQDGRQQIVGLQFAPDFLGRPFAKENALTAEAATDLEICCVSKAAFERLIAHTPELEHSLHQQALAELDEARDWMLTLGRKTAREKVASFLHMLATRYEDCLTADEVSFEIPLTRQEIADFLGLTIETVSRQMTRLRQDGLISIVDNRQVTVPDIERLLTVSGCA
jgi:CRP/FNR family transcriptional regulator